MPDFVSVRYLVKDVAEAVEWYCRSFGFDLISNQAPAIADMKRGQLRRLIIGPKSSAGCPVSDGEGPTPGGRNRIHLVVADRRRG